MAAPPPSLPQSQAQAATPILQACFPSFPQAAPVNQASRAWKVSAVQVGAAVPAAMVALALAECQQPVLTAAPAAREGLVAPVRAVLMADLEAPVAVEALEALEAVAVAVALAAPAAHQVRALVALGALVAMAALADSAAVAAVPALAVLAVAVSALAALAVSVASVEVAAAVHQ